MIPVDWYNGEMEHNQAERYRKRTSHGMILVENMYIARVSDNATERLCIKKNDICHGVSYSSRHWYGPSPIR